MGADGSLCHVAARVATRVPSAGLGDLLRGSPRTVVASLRKADGSPLDHDPFLQQDRHRNDRSGATTYWGAAASCERGIARYEPNSAASSRRRATGFPRQRRSSRGGEASRGAPVETTCSLWRGRSSPHEGGLYDRDALETWGRAASVCSGTRRTRCFHVWPRRRAASRTPPRSLAPRPARPRCGYSDGTTSACGITAPPASNSAPNRLDHCGPRTPLRRRRYSRRSASGSAQPCPRQARRQGQLLDLRDDARNIGAECLPRDTDIVGCDTQVSPR